MVVANENANTPSSIPEQNVKPDVLSEYAERNRELVLMLEQFVVDLQELIPSVATDRDVLDLVWAADLVVLFLRKLRIREAGVGRGSLYPIIHFIDLVHPMLKQQYAAMRLRLGREMPMASDSSGGEK